MLLLLLKQSFDTQHLAYSLQVHSGNLSGEQAIVGFSAGRAAVLPRAFDLHGEQLEIALVSTELRQ